MRQAMVDDRRHSRIGDQDLREARRGRVSIKRRAQIADQQGAKVWQRGREAPGQAPCVLVESLLAAVLVLARESKPAPDLLRQSPERLVERTSDEHVDGLLVEGKRAEMGGKQGSGQAF